MGQPHQFAIPSSRLLKTVKLFGHTGGLALLINYKVINFFSLYQWPFAFLNSFACHTTGNFLTEVQSFHGGMLVLTQIGALLMKCFRHTRRDWRGTLSSVLLPVIFVALAMALFTVKPLAIDYPSLKLTPGLYDNAESFFR